MLKTITADLHIHSCLSPCASLDMTPQKIVKEALINKLSIIAITDHNSAENVSPVIAASRGTSLYVIPGMEVTTSEEVHIIALFPTAEDALSMQDIVFNNLQSGENDEELFGMQVIANEFDEVEGFNKRLLIGATALSVDEVVNSVHKLGGMAIPAHVDREMYSLISQLGLIPDYLSLNCLEVSRNISIEDAGLKFSHLGEYTFITSSDAHELYEIGASPTRFLIEKPGFDEICMAIKNIDGRKVLGGI